MGKPGKKSRMRDQANSLRSLIERKLTSEIKPAATAETAGAAHTVAVTSGKGGVGKSSVALNLAVALAQMESRVCLLDGNLGLGNVDLLCGLNGYWNLSHVITGARSLADVMLVGPSGIHVIPGASGLTAVADCTKAAQSEIFSQLQELEQTHDFIVIDTGAGIHESVRRFVSAADAVLTLTTPEPTSIANAYASIKALSAAEQQRLHVLVNQAESSQQAHAVMERIAHTSRLFLNHDVATAGFIPFDQAVRAAVYRRVPFLVGSPDAPASRAVAQLARRVQNLVASQARQQPFFPLVCARQSRRAA
jgi:flagellar biosynthesis protein FlhG